MEDQLAEIQKQVRSLSDSVDQCVFTMRMASGVISDQKRKLDAIRSLMEHLKLKHASQSTPFDSGVLVVCEMALSDLNAPLKD